MANIVTVTVAGTDRSKQVDLFSVDVVDNLNEQPNTATFDCFGFTPAAEDAVVIGGASVTGSDRNFRGTITDIAEVHNKTNERTVYRVQCVDNTRNLDKTLITKHYAAQSATAIATDILTFTSGFTGTNIAASLPSVETDFKMQFASDALTQLALLIGAYWYIDEDLDLHFFLTESTGNPTDLTTANLATKKFKYGRNNDQIRNRIFVEGKGSVLIESAVAGSTTLKAFDVAVFDPAGGLAIIENQIISYDTSSQGLTHSHDWLARSTPGGWVTTSRIAWSPELGLFVVIQAGSTTVWTSPDGFTWTSYTGGSAQTWSDICWSPELTLFVVVNASGTGTTTRVKTSPDGTNWTDRTVPSANFYNGVCWSPELTLFVAVANSGANRVMTSPDGTNWTDRTCPSDNWRQVCWSAALTLFVAVAQSASGTAVMTSPDGINWTSRTSGTLCAVCWSPELSLFVGVDTNVVRTSTNGTTWTTRTAANGNAWQSVIWAAELGLFIAVGTGASANNVMSSTDGINWTDEPSASSSGMNDIVYASSLKRLVASGGATPIPFMTSAGDPYAILSGIPASGTGELVEDVRAGTDINLLVQRDDASSQASYGIREFFVQDRRLSIEGAEDRGDAELTTRKDPIVRGSYTTTDSNTRSGKSIVINQFGIALTATIMRVRIYAREGDTRLQRDVEFANLLDTSNLYTILRKLNQDRIA